MDRKDNKTMRFEDSLRQVFCDDTEASPPSGFSARVMNSVRSIKAKTSEESESDVAEIVLRTGFAAAFCASLFLVYGIDVGAAVFDYSMAAAELNTAEFIAVDSWIMF
jgi:hypothetical protein